MGKVYVLTEKDREILSDLIIDYNSVEPETDRTYGKRLVNIKNRGFVFIRVPYNDGKGIPARNEDNEMEGVECDVYVPKLNNNKLVLEASKFPGNIQAKLLVFNPYRVSWYSEQNSLVITRAYRTPTGIWFCEKPPHILPCKTTTSIPPGGTGVVNLHPDAGVSTGEQVVAALSWMSGGKSIPANREALIYYLEAINSWIFIGAEC